MMQKYLNAYTDYINDPFLSIDDACIRYGFCKSSFYRALKKDNLDLPKKQFFTTCDKEKLKEAIKQYRNGKSIIQISKDMNMGEKTISKYLHYLGEEIREYHKPTIGLTLNKNYFQSIDTPDKAYWYGFIMADGSVAMSKSYRLSIELNSIDEEHLIKFRTAIQSNHNIKHRKNRKISMIGINSKKLITDLNNYGCVPNKTEKGWFAIDKINVSLWKDILRGFLDGDGFIDKTRYRIIYTIKQKNIVENIIYMFQYYEIKMRYKQEKQYYRVYIEDKNNFYKILHLLYDNAKTYLNRKYKIYLSRINKKSPLVEMPKCSERN